MGPAPAIRCRRHHKVPAPVAIITSSEGEDDMHAEVLGNDHEYQRWLADNPNGFVLNTTRTHSPGYMVLHRASCPHISVASHESEPGASPSDNTAKSVRQISSRSGIGRRRMGLSRTSAVIASLQDKGPLR